MIRGRGSVRRWWTRRSFSSRKTMTRQRSPPTLTTRSRQCLRTESRRRCPRPWWDRVDRSYRTHSDVVTHRVQPITTKIRDRLDNFCPSREEVYLHSTYLFDVTVEQVFTFITIPVNVLILSIKDPKILNTKI